MGNACTHGAKVQARRVEETMGFKGGKKSETHDEELMAMKKELEDAVKILDKLVKALNSTQADFVSLGAQMEKYRTFLQTVPAEVSSLDVLKSVDSCVMGAQDALNDQKDEGIEASKTLMKKYIHEITKTVKAEYKLYNDARLEYDLYNDKLKGKMTEDKRDINEVKVEKAKEVFDLRKAGLKKKLAALLTVLPTMLETACVANCAEMSTNYGILNEYVSKLEAIVEQNTSLLGVTFESFNFKEKSETAIAAAEAAAVT